MHQHTQEALAMFRITKTEDRSRTTLAIDGRLSEESVATVETCCNLAGSDGKSVLLFLRDVICGSGGTRPLEPVGGKGSAPGSHRRVHLISGADIQMR